ncbi:Ubiquitin receptor RAD23b [Vitis vinifera]|uniref:Ubiquitin receptor RAD23 n=1 Tax=Vitis vinifera TaxID=29760 RepID=A0A438JWU2_VITVI|nr:Ubiquitin receptor RAD23b [Vitis vinifera]
MVSTYPLAVPSSCVKEFLLLIFSLDYAIFHFKSRILFPLRNAPYSVVIEQEDLDMFFLVLCAHFAADQLWDIFDQPEQELPHAINVTPAEQEAIERLEAMGFDRALVIEAFLACDRNERIGSQLSVGECW